MTSYGGYLRRGAAFLNMHLVYILSVTLQMLSRLHGERHMALHIPIREAKGALSRTRPPSALTLALLLSLGLHLSVNLGFLNCPWGEQDLPPGSGVKGSRTFEYFQGLARRSVNRTYWDISKSDS